MELRTVLLIGLAVLNTGIVAAGTVKRYPLDDRSLYAVQVGPDAPTTVMFPGPVTALVGAGISSRPEDNPAILLSHPDGAAYFSVRALHPKAAGAVNVVFRDRVYPLTFTTTDNPDRGVTFYQPTQGEPLPASNRSNPERLLLFLDQAKHYAAITAQYPGLAQQIEHTTPHDVTVAGAVTATVEDVFRFEDQDILILRVRLANHSAHALHYAPAGLTVRVAGQSFPVALTDASGVLPAGQADLISILIAGQADGGPAHLSAKNTFAIFLPVNA